MRRQYSKSRFVEPFRKLGRALDLLVLLVTLLISRATPPFRMLREMVLIELGPGPTRLATLKRMLFREVYFVDKFDFEIPDPGLRLHDLAGCEDVRVIVKYVCCVSDDSPVFIFADHFLEHMSEVGATRFLQSVEECGVAACFRVPNILSPSGKRNYDNDPTHLTPFDESLRSRVEGLGFSVFPWSRCYRFSLLIRAFTNPKSTGRVAEEIVLFSKTL